MQETITLNLKPSIKSTDEIADELIIKYFSQNTYLSTLSREKETIRRMLKEAVVIGEIRAISTTRSDEYDLLKISIAKSAGEFEARLPASTMITRRTSAAYPWGWCYVDDDLQDQFREFCRKKS